MKQSLAILSFALLTAALPARAQAPNPCPILPADSGLEWKHRKGPDYDVCYGKKPGAQGDEFGIYMGNAPSFHPKVEDEMGKGQVGGQVVSWYKPALGNDFSKIAQQTLVTLDEKSGAVAHVWVFAGTGEQIKQRLAVLEKIQFKK